MKPCFLFIALSFFVAAQAQTKQRNWDVRMAVGSGTYPYLQDGGRFLHLYVLGPEFIENAYTADVLYQTKNPKIKVGLAASFLKIDQYHYGDWNWSSAPEKTYVISTQKVTAIMPAFNYSYVLRRKSQLYSQLCFGAAFTTHQFYENKPATEHRIDPAFQCTFIGYRLGGKVGAFAETGYGYKGILQLGISGTF